ncbi:MAG: nitrile hydratase subunit alpha, partial [Gammaproteobacteria bacterium]|nr:nitrile hydratase subunit alpha [Gammaproteobacteria bacterium]
MTKTPTIADRVEALEALLTRKGIVTSEQLDSIVARYADQVGPLNGARLIARAWTDPEFKARLLIDATSVVQEWKLEGGQVDRLIVKENTASIHNVVVCTLCSCYPWAILGLPPKWYKSPEYRSRIVVEPRTVLGEMGLQLDEGTEIRVWDSSAEVRYLVLPEQPSETVGLPEGEL